MKETGILLASHGDFAKEALKSLEMIMGLQTNVSAISLEVGEDLEGFYQQMEETYQDLDKSNGVVVICDIFGGTPSNAAKMLLANYPLDEIAAYAGLNLATLLELMPNRKQSFQQVKELLKESKEFIWNEIEFEHVQDEEDEIEEGEFDL